MGFDIFKCIGTTGVKTSVFDQDIRGLLPERLRRANQINRDEARHLKSMVVLDLEQQLASLPVKHDASCVLGLDLNGELCWVLP